DQDDRLISSGLDAVALRTYNSQGLFDDDNADNWTDGIFKQHNNLQWTGSLGASGSSVTREDKDGAAALYSYFSTLNGITTYTSTAGGGVLDIMQYNNNTPVFTWTDGSTGTSETYDNHGVILSATDNRGNTLT